MLESESASPTATETPTASPEPPAAAPNSLDTSGDGERGRSGAETVGQIVELAGGATNLLWLLTVLALLLLGVATYRQFR